MFLDLSSYQCMVTATEKSIYSCIYLDSGGCPQFASRAANVEFTFSACVLSMSGRRASAAVHLKFVSQTCTLQRFHHKHHFCRDKSLVARNTCLLRQACVCHDKARLVACLSRQKLCLDQHTFVATKDVFCRDKKIINLRQLPPIIVLRCGSDLTYYYQGPHGIG